MVVIRRVLAVALFVGLLVVGWNFAHTNGEPVSVHYLLGKTEARPVWLVVSIAWSAGLAMAGLYLGLALLRDRIELRRLRKAVHGLEQELRDHRNKPVEEDVPQAGIRPATDSRPSRLGAWGGR